MPALIDIRRRTRSGKSAQQITKAMKMVSAAKLRRAQEAMFPARPYARKMLEVFAANGRGVQRRDQDKGIGGPAWDERVEREQQVLVVRAPQEGRRETAKAPVQRNPGWRLARPPQVPRHSPS